MADDLERRRVDHVDGVAQAVGHIDERRVVAHSGAQVAGGVGGIDVGWVHERWHAGDRGRHVRRAAVRGSWLRATAARDQ
jgi:hypothetical protein